MKRTISLWLGLLSFALLPALAQTPAPTAPTGPTGKIHGHVTNPSGAPQNGGTVLLVATDRVASGPGLSAKLSIKATFPVDANGDYSGETSLGIYKLIYGAPGTAQGQETDHIDGVKIQVGQDIVEDVDMSRKEFIDALPAEQKKQLQEMKAHNAEAMKANEVIKTLNADIKTAVQDFKDADGARATAAQTLGAGAARSDVDAKEAEIRTAKYTEVETLMLKDTALRPGESVLWAQLGEAQLGLKKYDDAETSYKKALDLEGAKKAPNPSNQGAADAGLGEIYARTGKVPDAVASYDAAAKVNPAGAATYLKNEAVIFSQVGNADAQVAAAEEAIKTDPTQALPYYLKGQGLIGQATIDPKTGKMILPPGCAEAYQKYLDLDPNGKYAPDVKAILAEATQTHNSSFGDQTSSKKKKGGNN